jgi:hypothetical protein
VRDTVVAGSLNMERSVDVLTGYADSPTGQKGEREMSHTLAAHRVVNIQTMKHCLLRRGAARPIVWRAGFSWQPSRE